MLRNVFQANSSFLGHVRKVLMEGLQSSFLVNQGPERVLTTHPSHSLWRGPRRKIFVEQVIQDGK